MALQCCRAPRVRIVVLAGAPVWATAAATALAGHLRLPDAGEAHAGKLLAGRAILDTSCKNDIVGEIPIDDAVFREARLVDRKAAFAYARSDLIFG